MKYSTYFFVLLALLWSNNLFAYDIAVKNADGVTIYYNYINDGKELEVASSSGNYGAPYSSFIHLEIPDSIEHKRKKYPVTKIGQEAFHGFVMLKSVVLSECVEIIGESAFYECQYLSSITLSKGLKEIGGFAFCSCKSLASIEIPDGVLSIGDGAFFGCTKLSSLTIPNSVTSIGDMAFKSCNDLSSLDIPKGVNSIGKGAFLNTSLETVTIPNSVTEIGDGAFTGVTSIKLEEGILNYELRNDNNILVEIATKKIISSCKNATIIPDDITNLGDYCFYNNQLITSIQIPNKVVSIGSNAFANSTLVSIKIPDGVKSIGSHAFEGCSGLTSVTIPNSVTTIGSGAFGKCSLSSIVIPNNVTEIEQGTFSGCPLSSIVIGTGVKKIFPTAFDFDKIPATAVVYLLSNDPPKYSKSYIKDNHVRWMEIHVPTGSKTTYQNDPVWGGFSNIMEFNPETFNPETMSEGEPILLSINHANNGKVIMEINNGEKYKFKAEPEKGWKVNAITFNGNDVTNQLDDKGYFTTPVITENSTLCISLEEIEGAAVRSETMSNIKIYAQENTLIVQGTEYGEIITIYDFEGKMIKNVQANNGTTEIPLPTNQAYIVKTSSKVVKVRL